MFKVVLAIDADQFKPRRECDLVLTGMLPFPLAKDTVIAGSPEAGKTPDFYVTAYGPVWRIQDRGEGYFHSQASLDGNVTGQAIAVQLRSRGWLVEDDLG